LKKLNNIQKFNKLYKNGIMDSHIGVVNGYSSGGRTECCCVFGRC